MNIFTFILILKLTKQFKALNIFSSLESIIGISEMENHYYESYILQPHYYPQILFAILQIVPDTPFLQFIF